MTFGQVLDGVEYAVDSSSQPYCLLHYHQVASPIYCLPHYQAVASPIAYLAPLGSQPNCLSHYHQVDSNTVYHVTTR